MQRATRSRLLPLLTVGALLAGAAVAASLATPQLHSAPLPRFSPKPASPPSQKDVFFAPGAAGPTEDPTGHIQLPSWVGTVLASVAVLLLLGVLGFLILMMVRARRRVDRVPLEEELAQTAEEQRAAVLAAVEAGLVDLDDGDPRAAVIACWVRLEQAAAAAGTPREPGDTPSDLVLRLLAEHQVSPDVLYPLAEVYRLARYATHTVDVTMRDQARAALRQLRAELTRPVEVPG